VFNYFCTVNQRNFDLSVQTQHRVPSELSLRVPSELSFSSEISEKKSVQKAIARGGLDPLKINRTLIIQVYQREEIGRETNKPAMVRGDVQTSSKANNSSIFFLQKTICFFMNTHTSNRMHGEFLRLLFLQAHRETEAHFTVAGMPSQRNQSESFRFKRAAFYQGLKSKVGLAAAKAAALRINLNVQGCSIVAAPMHAPSRTSLLLPLLLSHNLPLPRVR
jgi:hypothetical protein